MHLGNPPVKDETRRPFVVVWNMPTARCQQRLNVHLDLGRFDIVENRQQHQCGLLMDYTDTVLGPFVQSLRSDTKRCSLQICYGNGRGARRRLWLHGRLKSSHDL
ncbi:Hyaluronidase-3 [Liparis tanakae]|uniref:Hyaluronidase n=1 Tax=Liparis tanakae TaxID=230148 RepID=A0A4Z2HAJ8_9TELE|nr:Hyaluronidase-3 [Liparis tanakae]